MVWLLRGKQGGAATVSRYIREERATSKPIVCIISVSFLVLAAHGAPMDKVYHKSQRERQWPWT